MREFTNYGTLMAEVERVAARLIREILQCRSENPLPKGVGSAKLGDLTFSEVRCLEVHRNPITVEVFSVRNWGIQYRVVGSSYLNPNDNGSVHDLLRNSSPHGLPVEGSVFIPSRVVGHA